MKNLILFSILVFCLFSCVPKEDQLRQELQLLEEDIENIKKYRDSFESQIEDLEKRKDELTPCSEKTFMLMLEIKQERTMGIIDFEGYLKDELNAIELPIEVSERFYNSVEKGDKLKDEFRSGSFILRGSLSSWNISVKEKHKTYK